MHLVFCVFKLVNAEHFSSVKQTYLNIAQASKQNLVAYVGYQQCSNFETIN